MVNFIIFLFIGGLINTKQSTKDIRKLNRKIEYNNYMVEKLNELNELGLLDSDIAQVYYTNYQNLQIKLNKLSKSKYPKIRYATFDKIFEEKTTENKCVICGFPVKSLLENHHIIPASKGGKIKIKLCPDCHHALHKTIQTGNFDYVVKHLNNITNASVRFGRYVGMCL